jgi:hypothetical protein
MIRLIGAVLLAGALAVTGACAPKSTTPVGPTTDPVTETFTGTLGVGATASHPFTVKEANQVTSAILTQAGPPSTIFMGLGIGAWTSSTSTCTLLQGGAVQASSIAQLSGYTQVGTYCVQIFDVGNIPEGQTISYSVTVVHY